MADQRTTLPKRYQVPTHLQVVDKIAIGPVSVTIRQGAILLFGAALAYQCWHGLALLSDGGLGWLRVLMAGVLFGLSVALAQVRLSGRHLELWAVVWVRYRWQPRVYVWQHLPLRLTDAHSAQKGKP